MSVKRELIKGTLILTAAGVAARLLGFFNRVYLANLISNAELGRYQLIFPIFMFCMAVSCAGIQVAVSKMVAAYHGAGKKKAIRQTIKSAGIMSLIVALLSSGCVIAFSEPISRWILKDISCRGYLVIMAIAIPFAAVHTCVGGYFYGIRRTAVPAVTQLLEQVVRVVTIYLLGAMMYQKGKIDASVAVWGLAAGEIFSCFLTWICYRFSIRSQNGGSGSGEPIIKVLRQLWQYGGLLTANRVSVTLLQSTEMILMPVMLAKYYGDTESALSVFGIVTGIVLPVILFPNTVTNAMASLLLPAVAEAEEVHDYRAVSGAIKKSLEYCLLLGLFSGLVFGVCRGIHTVFCDSLSAYVHSVFVSRCVKRAWKNERNIAASCDCFGYPVVRCGCHDAKNGDLWLYCRCILGQCSSNGYRRGSSVSDCGKNK